MLTEHTAAAATFGDPPCKNARIFRMRIVHHSSKEMCFSLDNPLRSLIVSGTHGPRFDSVDCVAYEPLSPSPEIRILRWMPAGAVAQKLLRLLGCPARPCAKLSSLVESVGIYLNDAAPETVAKYTLPFMCGHYVFDKWSEVD